MRILQNLLLSEDGATAVEYSVMMALLLLAMFASITALGDTTSGLWSMVNGELDSRW
jgi:pilus assembly protein Flp/PilA